MEAHARGGRRRYHVDSVSGQEDRAAAPEDTKHASVRALARDRRFQNLVCLNNSEERATRTPLSSSSGGYYIHIDDVIVATGSAELSTAARDALAEEFEGMGFTVKRDTRWSRADTSV